ncbi:hypothetical protein AZE42_14200, partial [Rhizopogon vesiculosus]
MDVAVRAEGASFTWDSPSLRPQDSKRKNESNKMGTKSGKPKPKATATLLPPVDDANIFKVMDIDMEISR